MLEFPHTEVLMMKTLALATILVICVIFPTGGVAQGSSDPSIAIPLFEISFERLSDEVGLSSGGMQEIARLATLYRNHFEALKSAKNRGDSITSLTSISEALIKTRSDYRRERIVLDDLRTSLKRMSDYDLVASGWTKSQIDEAKKWDKIRNNIKKSFVNSNKIAPNEFDSSMLIYEAIGKWHQ